MNANACYQRLAIRVIQQALRDLESPLSEDRHSARTFLSGSTMLEFWCDLARVAPRHLAACTSGQAKRAIPFKQPK